MTKLKNTFPNDSVPDHRRSHGKAQEEEEDPLSFLGSSSHNDSEEEEEEGEEEEEEVQQGIPVMESTLPLSLGNPGRISPVHPFSQGLDSLPQKETLLAVPLPTTKVLDEDEHEQTASLDSSSDGEDPIPPPRQVGSKPLAKGTPPPTQPNQVSTRVPSQSSTPSPHPALGGEVTTPPSQDSIHRATRKTQGKPTETVQRRALDGVPLPRGSLLLTLLSSTVDHPYSIGTTPSESSPNSALNSTIDTSVATALSLLNEAITPKELKAYIPKSSHSASGHKLFTPFDLEAEPLDLLSVVPTTEDRGQGVAGSPLPSPTTSLSLVNQSLPSLMYHNLQNITTLHCAHNALTRLENLPFGLIQLDASCNAITTMDGLQHCPHLEVLNLRRNRLRHTDGLAGNLSLRRLYLGHNRITVVTAVEQLRKLEVLDLSHNSIKAITHLRALSLLSEVHTLHLMGNPLTSSKGYRSFLCNLLPFLSVLDNSDTPPNNIRHQHSYYQPPHNPPSSSPPVPSSSSPLHPSTSSPLAHPPLNTTLAPYQRPKGTTGRYSSPHKVERAKRLIRAKHPHGETYFVKSETGKCAVSTPSPPPLTPLFSGALVQPTDALVPPTRGVIQQKQRLTAPGHHIYYIEDQKQFLHPVSSSNVVETPISAVELSVRKSFSASQNFVQRNITFCSEKRQAYVSRSLQDTTNHLSDHEGSGSGSANTNTSFQLVQEVLAQIRMGLTTPKEIELTLKECYPSCVATQPQTASHGYRSPTMELLPPSSMSPETEFLPSYDKGAVGHTPPRALHFRASADPSPEGVICELPGVPSNNNASLNILKNPSDSDSHKDHSPPPPPVLPRHILSETKPLYQISGITTYHPSEFIFSNPKEGSTTTVGTKVAPQPPPTSVPNRTPPVLFSGNAARTQALRNHSPGSAPKGQPAHHNLHLVRKPLRNNQKSEGNPLEPKTPEN